MNANLVLVAQNGKQKIFPIPTNVTVIGRRKNCDFRIPLESVSRRHCQLSVDQESLNVRDLGSRNGTFLNGKKVEEQTVHAGDFLQIGPVTFTIQINGEPTNISQPAQTKTQTGSSGQTPANSDDLQDSLADLDGPDDLGDLDLEEEFGDLDAL